jgi:ABC-2 type transport system ATP-binding protein
MVASPKVSCVQIEDITGNRLAVRARGITKCFDDVVALEAVDLDVLAGQIHGLVGPNGAGKTTLLGLLLGLAVPDRGSLEVLGMPTGRGLAAPDGVTGFVDGPGLYPALTARGNLAALAALRGPDAQTADIDEVLEQVGLSDVAGDRVRGFSLGMRQRLGLASALLGDPELLVLDEPANGLDPEGVRWLRDFLRSFASGGRTVLISSHVLAEVAQTVDQVLIINGGRLVIETSLDRLTTRVGGSVRIRSPQLPRLAEALRNERIETTMTNDHALLAHATTSERVGDVAFRVGVPIHELVAEGSSLEEVFLELTSESQP